MSTLGLRRVSGAGGQGSVGRGLWVMAITVAASSLLAAGCTARPGGRSAAAPATTVSAAASGSPAARAGVTNQCALGTTCYTPAQLQVAYGIKPLLDRGVDGLAVAAPAIGSPSAAPPVGGPP